MKYFGFFENFYMMRKWTWMVIGFIFFWPYNNFESLKQINAHYEQQGKTWNNPTVSNETISLTVKIYLLQWKYISYNENISLTVKIYLWQWKEINQRYAAKLCNHPEGLQYCSTEHCTVQYNNSLQYNTGDTNILSRYPIYNIGDAGLATHRLFYNQKSF